MAVVIEKGEPIVKETPVKDVLDVMEVWDRARYPVERKKSLSSFIYVNSQVSEQF